MTNGKGRGAELVACTASPQGRYLYGAAEDGQMYIFDLKLGVLEEVVDMKIPGQPSSEAALVVHHPQRNLVAVLSRLGELSLLQG